MSDIGATALLLGLAAGVAPGPLLALAMVRSMQSGAAAGMLVALAPLITDVPIVAVCLYLVSKAAQMDAALALVGLLGGIYVVYLGWETLGATPPDADVEARVSHRTVLAEGALVNALSPHPYLFWLTVGGPLVIQASATQQAAGWWFIAVFYLCLVGSKAAIALLTARFSRLLRGRGYRWLLWSLGLSLMGLGGLLIRDGLAQAAEVFGVGT